MGKRVGDFDKNNIARAWDDEGWYLIDRNENRISEKFSYIEAWGEGYYKAERGAKKNILRPDGSIVLTQWHSFVWKVQHGFFVFENTIRKSKDNPTTRYVYGVANVNGDIIFPMIFDRMNMTETDDDSISIYAEVDSKPYFLTASGAVYDPKRGHLPKRERINTGRFFEKFVNWTLPGLQFFYRDTDAPIDVRAKYHVGSVIRAGFFIDVTTKLWKPKHKIRFLIASAHAAMLCDDKGIATPDSNVEQWNLCVLHFNSYFKVMDIYEKEGFTQIFLLHIPHAAALLLSKNETAIKFTGEVLGQDRSLFEMGRQSFDEKLKMEIHPRSYDKELMERMYHPVGLDNDMNPIPLDETPEPTEGEVATLSRSVHRMANDGDISDFIDIDDNFPYRGIKGYICEDCIYAKDITGNGEKCGRLTTDAFRDCYVKGRCEWHKTDISKPSFSEEMAAYSNKKKTEAVEKQEDIFALKTVTGFIDEKLGGDINRLRTYDFYQLLRDEKYGGSYPMQSNIVKSLFALVFADVWPGLNVESIEHYTYNCDHINHYQRLLGSCILYEYFLRLQKYNPSKELNDRAINVARLTGSIGNIWIMPGNFCSYLDDYKYRHYIDRYLLAIYNTLTATGKVDSGLKGMFYRNRKLMPDYNGREGFKRLIDNMMLNDYVDFGDVPKSLFDYVWLNQKELTREDYLRAVVHYLAVCEDIIPKRADSIIAKLKRILDEKG